MCGGWCPKCRWVAGSPSCGKTRMVEATLRFSLGRSSLPGEVNCLRQRWVRAAPPAVDLVGQLGSAASVYKVGLQLLTAAGPSFVRDLLDAGKQVFWT